MILPKIKRVHCHYHVELCMGYFPKPRHLVFFPQDATIWLREKLLVELFFHVISIFCLHRALDKIHTWKLFAYGKIRENQRRKKVLVRKKKKKRRRRKKCPKKKEKVPYCQEKKIHFLKRLVLAALNAGHFAGFFLFLRQLSLLLCRPQRSTERLR